MRYIVFLALVSLVVLTSCTDQETFEQETELYRLHISDAPKRVDSLHTTVIRPQLSVESNKMDVQHLLAILLAVDADQVHVANESLRERSYAVQIEQKEFDQPIARTVLDTLLHQWKLKLTERDSTVYELVVQDSAKYLAHRSQAADVHQSRSIVSPDTIIINHRLSLLAELLDINLARKIVGSDGEVPIDFNAPGLDFDRLLERMERELGVALVPQRLGDRHYIVEYN
jgi:hypothetical protein